MTASCCAFRRGPPPGRRPQHPPDRPHPAGDVAEFFRTYKNLEGRVTTITGWLDADAVPALLQRCIEAADQRDRCSRNPS